MLGLGTAFGLGLGLRPEMGLGLRLWIGLGLALGYEPRLEASVGAGAGA